MHVGADAVVDMAAPPPARTPDGAQADLNARSFDDHLDAAAPQARAEPESPTHGSADEDDAGVQADEPDGALVLTGGAPPPQPAQPALIQILASFAAATPAPGAEATPAPASSESAQPNPSGADANAAAPATPHAVPLAQAKTSSNKANAGAKASAPMPTQLGNEGAQQTSRAAETSQAAQAPPQASAMAPDGTASTQTAAPAPALTVLAASAPPPPANSDTRRVKASDAAKLSLAPPSAGIADAGAGADANVGASAKPSAQSKVAPAPAGAQTAPPRDGFALALAQHEPPQLASAPPLPASGLSAAHAAPASAVIDSAAQIAPAMVQVSREIIRRFNGESTRFEVRLDPPELGRVEVRLEVSRDHRVTAVVGADSPHALAELSRHARDLEQALQSAGLELTEGGLSFDLSRNSHDPDDANSAETRAARDDVDMPVETSAAQRPARPLGLQSWRGVRVDLVA